MVYTVDGVVVCHVISDLLAFNCSPPLDMFLLSIIAFILRVRDMRAAGRINNLIVYSYK